MQFLQIFAEVEPTTRALYEIALAKASEALGNARPRSLHLVYEDEFSSSQELTVHGEDFEDIRARVKHLLPDLRTRRFVAIGEMPISLDNGDSVNALSVYWQEPDQAYVQAQALAYYREGSTVQLDKETITLVPLPETWLPPQ